MSDLSAKRSVFCQQSGLSTVVGITGGIGSGKSTIARALEALGYKVYDCDKEAKRIITENGEVRKAIIALLGNEAFTPSAQAPFTGVYNTAYVADRVFAQPELLAQLNAIVHPAVKADILQRSALLGSEAVLFIESAILFEAGLDTICDKIILVEAPEEVRIARTIARDYEGVASEENMNKVRARIKAQKSPADLSATQGKIFTVSNDGSLVLSRVIDLVCDIATR